MSLVPADYLERMATRMAASGGSLEARFANPPPDTRVLQIIHGFPRSEKEHEAFLTGLMVRGFGGVVCNVHFDQYLRSEELWGLFAHGVELAKSKGMTLWLYDEQGYPSGVAGGQTLEGYPELQAQGLFVARAESEGKPVDVELPPGELLFAAACPAGEGWLDLAGLVDLTAQVDGNRLHWEPDGGRWQVFGFCRNVLFEGTHAAHNLFRKQPYINLLDPRATERFLRLTHTEYARRFPELDETFQATFTDEPSLMSHFLSPQKWAALPWADDLADTFRARFGYDLRNRLPALVADGAGPTGDKVRQDFWSHVGQRVADAYFGQIRRWCRGHGIKSSGHLLLEEDLVDHVSCYGDFYRCAEQLDYPSIDCLTSLPNQVPWHIAKLLGSIAHLHGAAKVMSETSDHVQQWRPPGDSRTRVGVTADDIRGTCDLLYVAGVNTTTSYYSWSGLSTAEQRAVNEYIGRCGAMLTGGHSRADIGVYYPIESVWKHFTPTTFGATDSERAKEIGRLWVAVQVKLFEAQRDFEVINGEALVDGQPEEGELLTGWLRLKLLILPGVEALPDKALAAVSAFRRAGGRIVLVGGANAARFFGRDPQGRTEISVERDPSGGALVYVPTDLLPALPKVLDALLEADVRVATPAPIRFAHRQVDGREVYFVINTSDKSWHGTVSFASKGPAQVWDPAFGSKESVPTKPDGRCQALDVEIDGYSGVFVVFPEHVERRAIDTGAELGVELAVRDLADVIGAKPRFGLGAAPHVDATIAPARLTRDGARLDAWTVDATIKAGGLDSWCFATTEVPKGALEGCDAIRIPTWAPPGQQRCAAPMCVIVREAGGAEYIVSLNRPLSQAGWSESIVWVQDMQPAGWSDAADHPLAPGDITAIVVGWGGHTGTEGEHIQFALSQPQVLSVR